MFGEHEVFVESSVQGYHAYFKYSNVSVGELMMCEIEENNEHDKYAVAVKDESGQIVGHVPIEISKINSWLERLRWSVLDTDIMWDKEKDSRFLSIIGCLEISSICKE